MKNKGGSLHQAIHAWSLQPQSRKIDESSVFCLLVFSKKKCFGLFFKGSEIWYANIKCNFATFVFL